MVGIAILVAWAFIALTTGLPQQWSRPLVSGQLLAVGGWLTLIGAGAAILWRSVKRARVRVVGGVFEVTAGVIPVVGTITACVGVTVMSLGAAVDVSTGGASSRAVAPALLAPFEVAIIVLLIGGAMVGRMWWPRIVADHEWVTVANSIQRVRYRRGQAHFSEYNNGLFVTGIPVERVRSPLAVVTMRSGRKVGFSALVLTPAEIEELNRGPGLNVPPR
ncbi:hypothetical protein GCM10009648_25570 [Tsukamurella spumae]